MPTIEITDKGLQALEGLDPSSNEARFLSGLEQQGPSESETLLRSLNPQQQQRVVDAYVEAGLIEMSQESSGDLIPSVGGLSSGLDIRFEPIKTSTEVRTTPISISDNGPVVGDVSGLDFSGFKETFEPEETTSPDQEEQV